MLHLIRFLRSKPLSNTLHAAMDKLQLTGQNLGRVFNSRSGCVCAMHLSCFETKLPNLMLKTRPKQLLGYLPLDIVLPDAAQSGGVLLEPYHKPLGTLLGA
jgi:hypothetical protein